MKTVGSLKNPVRRNLKKKPPAFYYPASVERQYIRMLYTYVGEIKKNIQNIIFPRLPNLIIQANYNTPVDSSPVRKDDLIDDINALLFLFLEVLEQESLPFIRQLPTIAFEISAYNGKQIQKFETRDLAVDIFKPEPWLKNQLDIFSNQNAQLINSLAKTETDRVSNIISQGLQAGDSYKTLQEELEKTIGVTKRHAKFIARDQTAKLNGSLTRLRMTDLGIDEFVWQTSGDERVRKSHAVLNGKRCKFDSPNLYFDEKSKKWLSKDNINGDKTNPSENYNCRCQALPFIRGLYNYDT